MMTKYSEELIEQVAEAIESVPTYLPFGHEQYGKYSLRRERALQAIAVIMNNGLI